LEWARSFNSNQRDGKILEIHADGSQRSRLTTAGGSRPGGLALAKLEKRIEALEKKVP
jgi:photosystem II stability/assembly factor-like uncharacterized protein